MNHWSFCIVSEGYTATCDSLDWTSNETCVITSEATSLDFVLYEISNIVVLGQGGSEMTLSLTSDDEALLFYPWPHPQSSNCSTAQCILEYGENPVLLDSRRAAASFYGADETTPLETAG